MTNTITYTNQLTDQPTNRLSSETPIPPPQALLSLLKTTAEMARHEEFICNFSSTALSILYERMPGYKCKMGCGLHMGWAVEGAIGSDKKIDASYISPHVNWSEFLESSTKEYGVPVLMSEPFYKLLSDDVKKFCRQVDNIKKSASDEVTGLYTYDVNPDYDFKAKALIDAKMVEKENQQKKQPRKARRTFNNKGDPSMTPTGKHRTSFLKQPQQQDDHHSAHFSPKLSTQRETPSRRGEAPSRHHRMSGRAPNLENSEDYQAKSNHTSLGDAPEIILPPYTVGIWTTDEDLVAMRTHMSTEILDTWDGGMHAFIEGDWKKATEMFQNVLNITAGKDGPSKNILRHMEEDYGGKVPMDWRGYRDMS